jgi:hypothetical protein
MADLIVGESGGQDLTASYETVLPVCQPEDDRERVQQRNFLRGEGRPSSDELVTFYSCGGGEPS